MCLTEAGPMTPVDATPGVPGIHESGARPCEHQFSRRPCLQHPLDLFTHKLRCFSMNKLGLFPYSSFGYFWGTMNTVLDRKRIATNTLEEIRGKILLNVFFVSFRLKIVILTLISCIVRSSSWPIFIRNRIIYKTCCLFKHVHVNEDSFIGIFKDKLNCLD